MGVYYCNCCDQYKDSHDGCVECEHCKNLICEGCVNIYLFDEKNIEVCVGCESEDETIKESEE